jgi:hypothetical protein
MVVEGRNKMNVKLIRILLLLSMVGCTQMPKVGNDAARNIKNSGIEAANSTSANPELTAEILFDFTLGEIALQRNQLDVAVESFTRLAKKHT